MGEKEGWMRPFGESKWHYFDQAGRTLCKQLAAHNPIGLIQGSDDSPDNCRKCLRALQGKESDG